ncbi:hypothetical protein DM860_006304 [Cuscuta australis]|uniref:Uncharacterized protein n=1 Tax=Cuscuta australis TaxID=267555 RepID=A0A328DLN8_9ASTE|nr:hypothetical protein DM860_006304 [Cuscuta australis]
MQEEGWPLGLQPLSLRAGVVRNRDQYLSAGSSSTLSFNSSTTLLTYSPAPSSTLSSSSALDTQSMRLSSSLFINDTMGSPIGVPQMANISSSSSSRRRGRSRNEEEEEEEAQVVVAAVVKKSQLQWRKCFSFSLCPTVSRTDASEASIVRRPSSSAPLAHFLAVERRANCRQFKIRSHRSRVRFPAINYVPDEYDCDVYRQDDDHIEEPNSLFTNGHIAPPPPKLREWGEHYFRA